MTDLMEDDWASHARRGGDPGENKAQMSMMFGGEENAHILRRSSVGREENWGKCVMEDI
jgi:hypothetical protein